MSDEIINPNQSTAESVNVPGQPVVPSPITASTDSVQAESPAESVESPAEEVAEPPAETPGAESPDTSASLQWTATESEAGSKGMWWYLGLVLVVVVLLVLAVIFKLWLSIGVFIAMGAAVAVYARRGAHTQAYQLNSRGLTVGSRFYPYENLKSFGVVADPRWHAIDFELTARFMPRLNVLYNDADFGVITSLLSLHLPRMDREPDLVERITRWLRF